MPAPTPPHGFNASGPIVLWSPWRGHVSSHRTIAAATRALDADRQRCWPGHSSVGAFRRRGHRGWIEMERDYQTGLLLWDTDCDDSASAG